MRTQAQVHFSSSGFCQLLMKRGLFLKNIGLNFNQENLVSIVSKHKRAEENANLYKLILELTLGCWDFWD